jgi:hypothetical protein
VLHHIRILFGIHVGVFAGYIDQHRRAAGSDIYNGPNRTIIAILDSRPPRKQPRAEENPSEMTHPKESGLDTEVEMREVDRRESRCR